MPTREHEPMGERRVLNDLRTDAHLEKVALGIVILALLIAAPWFSTVSLTVISSAPTVHATVTTSSAFNNRYTIPGSHAHYLPMNRHGAGNGANPSAGTWNTSGCFSAYGTPCGPLSSSGGPVMHNPEIYIIFWEPSGYHYDNNDTYSINPSDALYEKIMEGFFINATNSAWMSVAQQYTDGSGAPGMSITLKGVIHDSTAFPCGSGCNSVTTPLSDADVQSEVASDVTKYSLPTGSNVEYFVYTPLNIIQCFNSPGQSSGCSANAPSPYSAYCAYHNSFTSGTKTIIYAEMPDDGTLLAYCSGYQDNTFPYGPNGDEFADWEISISSHEFMESITDPEPSSGWTVTGGSNPNDVGAEIGDLCSWVFPPTPHYDDMPNILMGPQPFFIQPEYSNSQNAANSAAPCVLPTEPGKAVPSFTVSNPASISAGGVEHIYINATDSGAAAGWDNVTVDFPSNPPASALSVVSTTFPGGAKVVLAGNTTVGCYSLCPITTGYPAIQAHTGAWSAGTTYSLEVAFKPPANGTYQFYVKDINAVPGSAYANDWAPHSNTVTDQQKENVTSYSFTVGSGTSPLTASLTANPASVTLGNSTTLSTSASGGTGPYSFVYTGLPPGCAGTSQSFSCTPTSAGTYKVSVTVTDSASHSTTASTNVTVTPAIVGPTITSFAATPNPVTLGSSVNIAVTASGGTPPLSYAYTGLPAGCSTTNASSFTCTPTATGAYSITVVVTDAVAKTATQSTPLTVASPPGPAITSFTAGPSTITQGSSTFLNVTVVGGTQPYTYTYSGLPTGCASADVASLSCTPSGTGTFSINVNVTDAKAMSATASTQLTVNAPPTLVLSSFTVSPASIQLGQSAVVSVSASGGVTPYTYAYTGLPAGCSTIDSASFSCTPVTTGSFTISVRVSDPAGQTSSQSASLSVVNAPGSPVISFFAATPANIVLGASVNFSVGVTGGTAPYTFLYSGLPSGCSSVDSDGFACTPTAAGNFTVGVKVTDSAGHWTSSAASIVVTPDVGGLVISSFTVTPSTTYLNQPVNFSVSVSGGTAPYTYTYSSLPAGCVSTSRATLPCSPTQGGKFSVSVVVSDKSGGQTASTTHLDVLAYGQLSVSASASVNPVSVGSPTVISVSVTGGEQPFTYSYTGLPQGCTSTNTNALTCTPSQSGNFSVVVQVSDASGQQKATTVALTVQPAASSAASTVLGIPTTIFLILLIVIIAVVVVAAVLLRRHRTRGSAPPPPPQPWAPTPSQPGSPPPSGPYGQPQYAPYPSGPQQPPAAPPPPPPGR